MPPNDWREAKTDEEKEFTVKLYREKAPAGRPAGRSVGERERERDKK